MLNYPRKDHFWLDPRLLLLLGLLVGAAGWSPAQPGGEIRGTITSTVSGIPLSGCRVTLYDAGGSQISAVRSDRRGRYVFRPVPPGEYLVGASRPFFASGRFGQKDWNGIGKMISLEQAASFTADVYLHRLGVISGIVLDENGEGIPEFPVQATRAHYSPSTGPVSKSAHTDDRGYFRIPGLRPGAYFVGTLGKADRDGDGYVPTYHPSHLKRSDSPIVRVKIDEEVKGIDLQPQRGHLVRLSGQVPGAMGALHSGAVKLHLFQEEKHFQASPSAEGNFVFNNLVPGRYTLIVEVKPPGRLPLSSYQQLNLDDDTDGITIRLAAAPRVRIRLLDQTNQPAVDPQILVFLSRVENYARTTPQQARRIGKSHWLAADGLLPGRWRIFAVCPESYFVDSIEADSKQALAELFLMPGQEIEATIRLAGQPGSIRGRVLAKSGRPIPTAWLICYPLDEKNRLRLAGFRQQRSNARGEFRFAGLPKGNYLLIASSVEPGHFEDQLDQLQGKFPTLRVSRGTNIEQDVTIADTRE